MHLSVAPFTVNLITPVREPIPITAPVGHPVLPSNSPPPGGLHHPSGRPDSPISPRVEPQPRYPLLLLDGSSPPRGSLCPRLAPSQRRPLSSESDGPRREQLTSADPRLCVCRTFVCGVVVFGLFTRPSRARAPLTGVLLPRSFGTPLFLLY